jgi:uncharacterized membrane protein
MAAMNLYDLSKFFHLAAAIFWMGGMAFMILALRGPAGALEPPARLRLLGAVMARFVVVVIVSIAVLLVTGAFMFLAAGTPVPPGWHAMTGLGLLMILVFGHLYFSPFRKLKRAVANQDWPEGGKRAGQIALLAKFNLGLGWLAIAAVMLWR